MRIGVDLGGTKIEVIVLDDHGQPTLRRRCPTPAAEGYDAVVAAVCGLVREAAEATGEPLRQLGVATPGALVPGVAPQLARLRNANTTCLNGRLLARDLAQQLSCAVRLDNDANCFARSEAVDGAAAGARVVFGVILGTGTGGGLVVDGRTLSGPNAIAGEWGHNPLPWPRDDERPGPACYCGRHGCIETFLSGPGLAREHAGRAGGEATARTVAAQADAGDLDACASLDRYVDRLARSLASVINVVDPDVIVLGGGLSNIERLYPDVVARWGDYVFADAPLATRLVRAAHGDSSGVRGAAWLWP